MKACIVVLALVALLPPCAQARDKPNASGGPGPMGGLPPVYRGHGGGHGDIGGAWGDVYEDGHGGVGGEGGRGASGGSGGGGGSGGSGAVGEPPAKAPAAAPPARRHAPAGSGKVRRAGDKAVRKG